VKLSPQHIGRALGDMENRIDTLEEENESLFTQIDFLKTIVEQTLMKNNPDFKRHKVLKDMDDFLGSKIGRTRTTN